MQVLPRLPLPAAALTCGAQACGAPPAWRRAGAAGRRRSSGAVERWSGGAGRLQRALRGMAAPPAHACLESRTAARFATAWRLRAGPKAGTGRGEAAVLAAAGPARI